MNKNMNYKSANLPTETLEYIKEVERNLSQKVGKDIALVAYAKDDGRE